MKSSSVHVPRSFRATDVLRGVEVSAKWASGKGEFSALANEWRILHHLRPGHFARPVEFGRVDDSHAWMTTRRLDAESLAEHEGLSATDLIEVTFDALDGLAALHRAGYVHGDVRPQNLLIRRGDRGLSAFWVDLEHAVHFDHLAAGFAYISGWHATHLERGQPQTPRADLAALGGLLAERLPRQQTPGDAARACLAEFASELESENPDSTLLNGEEARYRLSQLCRESAIPMPEREPETGPPVFVVNRAAQRWWRTSWPRWQGSAHPRIVRLAGSPGSGKSSFLRTAAALAALDGHRVLDLLHAAHGDALAAPQQPDWSRVGGLREWHNGIVLVLLPVELYGDFFEHAGSLAAPGTVVVVECRHATEFGHPVPPSWQLEECAFPPFRAREWFQWVNESF